MSTDLPDNIDQQWIGRTLLGMQRDLLSLRDDVTVATAILNRIDHNQSSFIEELRAMRMQQERLRSRVDRLEREETP
jgi:ubiquinone biosynthesis protein UbiJ